MADQLGIDELPMRRPDFDFYAHAVYHLKQMGFTGQDLFHDAHEVIQLLFFNIRKGTEGPIYKYVDWYENRVRDGIPPQPFDEFFKYAFRQKAVTALKKSMNRAKKRGLSIEYGRGEDEGSVGEEFLGEHGGPSPEAISMEQEEQEKRKGVFKEIPRMLSEHRHGDILISIWELMKKNYKLAEMADELNAKRVLAPRGGDWGTGAVHKVRNQVYGLVKRFLEQRGIDWESIAASRQGFRFGFVPEG
jgi:hypothetical protein